MEIDRRRIRRLIRQARMRERTLDRVIRGQAWIAGPIEFVKVGTRDDFPEGEMRRVEAEGLPLFVRERGGIVEVRLAHPLK